MPGTHSVCGRALGTQTRAGEGLEAVLSVVKGQVSGGLTFIQVVVDWGPEWLAPRAGRVRAPAVRAIHGSGESFVRA